MTKDKIKEIFKTYRVATGYLQLLLKQQQRLPESDQRDIAIAKQIGTAGIAEKTCLKLLSAITSPLALEAVQYRYMSGYTVRQTAEHLGYSRAYIHKLCAQAFEEMEKADV